MRSKSLRVSTRSARLRLRGRRGSGTGPAWDLFVANRQTFSAPRTPSLEHQAPILRTHPNQKSMGSPTSAHVWLKSPLPLHDLSGVISRRRGAVRTRTPWADDTRRQVNSEFYSTILKGVNETASVLRSRSSTACLGPRDWPGVKSRANLEGADPKPRPDVWSLPKLFHSCGKTC